MSIVHYFQGAVIFRSFKDNQNIYPDIDFSVITNLADTILSQKYDGIVYINETPYRAENIISANIRVSDNINQGTTIIEESCCLCYGDWTIRTSEGRNVQTNSITRNESLDIVWMKYSEEPSLTQRTVKFVESVNVQNIELRLSLSQTDVIQYINNTYNESYSTLPISSYDIQAYVVCSIDDYNGILLAVNLDL